MSYNQAEILSMEKDAVSQLSGNLVMKQKPAGNVIAGYSCDVKQAATEKGFKIT